MVVSEEIRFRSGVFYTLSFITVLWLIRYVEWVSSSQFGFLGIMPRDVKGMLGIITAPLIHGDFFHLISNTFPLILLGIGLIYFYHHIALEVVLWIYFSTGFWVWLAAREAYHIGASGLVYGLVAFMFFSGMFRRDARSVAIALVIIFLYGGMFSGVLPLSNEISWESHLLGSVAGMFSAFYYRNAAMSEEEQEESILDDDDEEDMIAHEELTNANGSKPSASDLLTLELTYYQKLHDAHTDKYRYYYPIRYLKSTASTNSTANPHDNGASYHLDHQNFRNDYSDK